MKKNLLFAILCVLGLFGTLNAQDVVTIDGTVGGYKDVEGAAVMSNQVPIYDKYNYTITQQYYSAQEINKSAGTIESIAFKTAYKTDVNTGTLVGSYPVTRNLIIYIANTEEYNFGIAGKTIKAMSENDMVFSGEVTFESADAWTSIDIKDFEYTGENILLCVNDITGGASVQPNFTYFSTFDCIYKIPMDVNNPSELGNAYRVLYKYNSANPFDATVATTGASTVKQTPYVQFVFKSGTTEEYADPSDPTNFVATAVNESKIQLTWDAAAETESYNIYEGTNLVAAEVEGTEYTIKNLALGQYCYTIKGVNGPKESTGVNACATLVAKPVESITIGSPDDKDSQTAPMALFTQDSWVEQVYTATEIGGACTIERISFAIKAQNNYSKPFETKDIKIYLAETEKTDYADKAWTAESDLVLVYSETGIIIGDQEWETFELDKSFNYSGTKNLAVVVVKSAEEMSAQYFWHTNEVTNSVLYAETATYPVGTTEANATNTRPVIRFSWATGEAAPTVPGKPIVNAEATSTSTIVLTWSNVEGATSYNVYQGETKIASELNATTYTVEGLETYTEYSFQVSANNEVGESEKSDVKSIKTLDLAIETPSNLVAKEESASSIVLTWSPVENALLYKVYRGTNVVEVTDTTCTVEDLLPYQEYCFQVSAVRNETETAKTESVCAKTLDLVVAAPTELAAVPTSDTTIVLTWKAGENALSYNVYLVTVDTVGVDTTTYTLLANVEETTYTAIGLTAETEYCFAITSVRNEKETEKVEVRATTLVAEENIVIGDYATTFFYDFENGTLEGWNVTDANKDGLTWVYKNGADGGLNDGKGLLAETPYTGSPDDYLVTTSKYSMTTTSELSFMHVQLEYMYPLENVAVVVSEDGEEFEEVWSYKYTEYTQWNEAKIDLSAYAGQDLYIGLHHYNCDGATAAGLRVDNIKLDSKEPSVPTNLTATATATTVTLTWNAAANSTSYNVYAVTTEVVEEVETVEYTLVKDGVKETTFVVEGLTLATEYSYTVTAVNEFKESKYAAVVTVTTLSTDEPTEPVVLAAPVVTVDTITSTSIVFVWNAVEGAKEYAMYFGEEKLGTTEDTIAGINGLDPNMEYCVTVTAVCDTVESAHSEKACATTLSGEGIEENATAFNIYPNPVNDKLYIETEVEIETVVVYTITGVVVGQQSMVNGQQLTIDVANLNSGIYFVKVVTENGETVKRFIKD